MKSAVAPQSTMTVPWTPAIRAENLKSGCVGVVIIPHVPSADDMCEVGLERFCVKFVFLSVRALHASNSLSTCVPALLKDSCDSDARAYGNESKVPVSSDSLSLPQSFHCYQLRVVVPSDGGPSPQPKPCNEPGQKRHCRTGSRGLEPVSHGKHQLVSLPHRARKTM